MEAYGLVLQRTAAAAAANNVQSTKWSKRMKCASRFALFIFVNEICELVNDDRIKASHMPNNKFQKYNFNVIIYEWKLRCVTFLDSRWLCAGLFNVNIEWK